MVTWNQHMVIKDTQGNGFNPKGIRKDRNKIVLPNTRVVSQLEAQGVFFSGQWLKMML